MLDRALVMNEIRQNAHKIFAQTDQHYNHIFDVWRRIIRDPTFAQRVATAQAPWPLPSWQGNLDTFTTLSSSCMSYTALSVDGSQIYPDRHQGTGCFLINIGSVAITYGAHAGAVRLHSRPYLFTDDVCIRSGMVHDAVDSMRQEYELSAGTALVQSFIDTAIPMVLLFDGTLIFWHLDTKDAYAKDYYLPRYCTYLSMLAELQVPTAGYISLPRSKELVNLVRFALCNDGMSHDEANACVARVTDVLLLKSLLPVHARTIVFMSNSIICAEYPAHVRPYFWYLHVGDEIARVEAPAWVARNDLLVDAVSTMILDQCNKGRGYPVVLAEAHEQAVIKSADRDFFYHCIRKLSIEQHQQIMPSQKSIKKRGLGI